MKATYLIHYGDGKNIRQIQPTHLTLFDLALVAHIVHEHSPLYSAFKNQCYWFVCLVCEVILSIDPCRAEDQLSKETTLEPEDYLPDLAGQWHGLLVCDVEKAIVAVLVHELWIRKEEYMAQVQYQLWILKLSTNLLISLRPRMKP